MSSPPTPPSASSTSPAALDSPPKSLARTPRRLRDRPPYIPHADNVLVKVVLFLDKDRVASFELEGSVRDLPGLAKRLAQRIAAASSQR